ncbi:hypothetical protein BN14_08962 [Rhizoctonia solani AG-1 IB]|uniref:Ricin B lectin domain-containing protein n=1 Tax=Thanatephorus cucumeris (strain AG1-IB / isolate 7/3/14) TaxID=1108050 RepID=M5C4G5_THACB|nr:hypothetical protein BN14_08962 [Rhizoctonia solani AG-1 IB]
MMSLILLIHKGTSKIKPGHYYVSNLETGQLLQFVISPETGRPCVQVGDGNFKKSQLWIIEEGANGYKLRAHFPGAYIGHAPADDSGNLSPQIVALDNAVEFRLEGGPLEGFSFIPTTNTPDEFALTAKGVEPGHAPVLFTKNTGAKLQRWLLEEDDGLDSLELHQGPIAPNTPLRIRDAVTKTPLQLAFKDTKWPWVRVKSEGDWILEAGFTGYYLKHIASGLYMSLADAGDEVKIRALVLSSNKTEFTLIGDHNSGYSIEYVENRQFGVKLDEDPRNPKNTAFLSWQPDNTHPKWQFETIGSN